MCKRLRTKFIQRDNSGNYYCYKCHEYKSPEEFDYNPKLWFRDNKDRRCKKCKHEQYLKRRAESRGKQDLDRLLLERFHGALERSRAKKLPLNITLDYLKYLWNKQDGKCALSGIQMTFIFGNGRIPTNVSIDRIDPKEGYIMGNIQLVCMACNQIKSDLTESEMYEFCKKIVDNYENKNNRDSR